jgi:hypothetical protein
MKSHQSEFSRVLRTWFSAAAGILLVSAWLSQVVLGQTATMTPIGDHLTAVSVNSSRPLAEVLEALQQKYLVPMTFEEAPFESEVELRAVPIRQLNGSVFTFRELPVVDFNIKLNDDDTAIAAAQSALSAYTGQSFPGVYDMIQEGDRIRVFPKQVRAQAGSLRDIKPVMDYPVTFPIATRGSVETLQLLASIISRESGAHVEPLNVPFHLGDTITMGADGESARDVIKHMGEIFHVPFSFQCLYEPTSKTYYLNVKGVFAPNPAGVAARHGLARPAPSAGPASSPWFTKN